MQHGYSAVWFKHSVSILVYIAKYLSKSEPEGVDAGMAQAIQ